MNNQQNATLIIARIVSHVSGASVETVQELIEKTNEISGCKLVSLRGYSSDATNNTEVANHVVNVGAVYENMKVKDSELLPLVETALIDVDTFNYAHINLNGNTLDTYKALVRAELPNALHEMIIAANTPATPRANNDVWLNRVLVFNNNTNSLSVFGQSINKVVEIVGEEKLTKKAAKTVAKEMIKKEVERIMQNKGLPTALLRRFKISNLNTIKINGDTLEIE
jgi:hypothetical protein